MQSESEAHRPDLMDMGVLSRIDTAASLLIADAGRAGGMPSATSRNTDQSSVHLRGYPIQSHTAASMPCLPPGQRRNKGSLRIPRVIRFSLTRELYGPEQGYIKALDLLNSHLGRCVPSVARRLHSKLDNRYLRSPGTTGDPCAGPLCDLLHVEAAGRGTLRRASRSGPRARWLPLPWLRRAWT
jgi:hypothetical protein